MKFNHLGIPTKDRFEGEINLPHLKMTVSDHKNNPYGIQWQRYWDDALYPELVKTVPHVAFEVDDLQKAIKGKNVIIQPNSPSKGLLVAFIEENGAPVELMQYEDENIQQSVARDKPTLCSGSPLSKALAVIFGYKRYSFSFSFLKERKALKYPG